MEQESEPEEHVERYGDLCRAFRHMVNEIIGHGKHDVEFVYVLNPNTHDISAFCSITSNVETRYDLTKDVLEKCQARFGNNELPKWYLNCAAYHWRPPLLIVSY